MLELKKRQLEARGWKIGTTEEFLDLSAEETSYIELKLKLAASLRKRRSRRRLTQAGLAKLVRSSQSRVAKMETGDPSVSVDLLIRALLALGASNREIAGAIAPTRKAESS
jgi:DNA-binding XRE family transcriptional regulator